MCTNGPPCPPGRACSATRTVGWPWMACAASPTSTSEEARMNENTRRTFLKAATTIPIIGGAELSDLQKPWDFKDFIYVRNSVEYSSRKTQGAKIPGFVVRLPDEFVTDK